MSHEGPDPDPDEEPVAPPPSTDPFERARAAIRASKEARGVDPDAEDEDTGPPPPRDVQSVLERAAAREQAAVGRAGLEREARAREELARLKGGPAAASPSAADDGEEKKPPTTGPRPRRL